MTDDPGDPAAAEADDRIRLRKEQLRSDRRIRQLQETLTQLEQVRDTNARLLDRLMLELEAERSRSHQLLLNVLPQVIIDRLNAGERLIADRHDGVAIVFSDFVGFTDISGRLEPARLVADLNDLFSTFDAACDTFGVEKIKTIGDAYFAAAGLPGMGGDGAGDGPVAAAADLALAMRDAVSAAGEPWQMRIGVHVGPVTAGVIGTRKYVYDLWGDAVNVASRLESTAPPGRIQVSGAVASALGAGFRLEPHGPVELKGKGATDTWILQGRA